MSVSRVTGRLAPSPTGLLHLGNAWSFLLAWLACRAEGGTLVLRMEDLDPARSRSSYIEGICADLHWLGLDWDEGPDLGGPHAPYVQSARSHLYAQAIRSLEDLGLVYPCFCTRKDLRSLAGAPHVDEIGPVYPGTCRTLSARERAERLLAGRRYALRLNCSGRSVAFTDRCFGPQVMEAERFGGDFALQRSDGVVAYQLAVALDDALMGVNQVVRGRDLLVSTARQLLLLQLLHLPAPATYAHVPLLLDEEGERLAKRHQSLSLASLRARGVRPERVIALLAHLAGLLPHGAWVSCTELVQEFSFDRLPTHDLKVTRELLAEFFS